MTSTARVAVGTAGALIAGGIAAAGVGRAAWERESARAVERLRRAAHREDEPREGSQAATGPAVDPPLPPRPVRRYLRWAISSETDRVRLARIRWRGEFRLRPGARWAPFHARQEFSLQPPGFVWDARIHLLPGVTVRVRDGYLHGSGSVVGRIGGLLPVADAAGTPEIAQSALARWLGEAPWFPTALLPGGPVTWQAIDEASARALVVDGPVRAEGEFTFAPSGEIVEMRAIRFRDTDGRAVATPFQGRYGGYLTYHGIHIPGEAEVAWLLEDGPLAYWRARVVEGDYQA